MLSSLSIAYLFLGGTGAGAVLVACLLDMLWAHEPFGAAAPCSLGASSLQHRAIAFTCAAGTLCLIAGSLCLLFDLGRLDRAIFLIQNPSLTYLTFGAVALGLLIACAAFLTLIRFVYVPIIPGVLVVVIESLACVLSLGVMLYTGLLLDSLGSVSVWNTPLVPMLFLLSSVSCGIAVALVCAFFDGHAVGGFAVPRILIFADAAIVSGEFVATVLYGLFPPVGASFASLATGDALVLLLWWLGFVFCGIAAPLVLETIAHKRLSLPNRSGQAFACLAIASVLVLVGGACLRVGVVNVGSHAKMELRASIERPVQTDDTGEEWLL
ncbi:NrfD/PsrC family molybdoenzyme membrane anchor subunit [Slackia isoflavoniconvertens]|jgi:polysulphide reductase nrfD|uniref:NrfD/PsrC family molybdoenzyme membrane anchor subunit n=1 Tax=Slackia isoflavoniconvertens TaxID=572010 RepID=UPI00248F354A|nr:NrfD/PsrC family molybdoenzyme membrane anchor subunit [Slackia isoflavoniconvertens]